LTGRDPLHHQPAGTVGQGTEAADQGGRGVLWSRGAGEARILDVGAEERKALGGNTVGKMPCPWTHSMRRYRTWTPSGKINKDKTEFELPFNL